MSQCCGVCCTWYCPALSIKCNRGKRVSVLKLKYNFIYSLRLRGIRKSIGKWKIELDLTLRWIYTSIHFDRFTSGYINQIFISFLQNIVVQAEKSAYEKIHGYRKQANKILWTYFILFALFSYSLKHCIYLFFY